MQSHCGGSGHLLIGLRTNQRLGVPAGRVTLTQIHSYFLVLGGSQKVLPCTLQRAPTAGDDISGCIYRLKRLLICANRRRFLAEMSCHDLSLSCARRMSQKKHLLPASKHCPTAVTSSHVLLRSQQQWASRGLLLASSLLLFKKFQLSLFVVSVGHFDRSTAQPGVQMRHQ